MKTRQLHRGLLAALLAALLQTSAAAWTARIADAQPAPAGIGHFVRTMDGAREVELRLLIFDAKKFTLRVIDDPRDELGLASAMARGGCVAGVNGAYFHPDRTPLGLVVSDGRLAHKFERAKLLSGVLVVTARGVSLQRAAEFRGTRGVTQALQAGPFLVDGGRAVGGLNATRSARRTVVLSDGKGGTALLVTSSATLAEMAQILATPGAVPGMKVTRALNLDGGSSTGVWVRRDGGAFVERPFKSVRNYVGIVPRGKP
jgi:uncharacterized protein YigE (DUF2233 family)